MEEVKPLRFGMSLILRDRSSSHAKRVCGSAGGPIDAAAAVSGFASAYRGLLVTPTSESLCPP